jgi:hypothetical protein
MSGGSGSGNGTVNFSVTANTGTSPRNGSLTVAGQTVSVTQCGFNVAPTSQTMPAAAGNNSVSVTTAAACSWGATSSAAWITITNAGPGAGNGSVSYSVTANPTTSQRSGTLTVAGRTVAINQTGMCAFALSGTNQNVPAAGGSSSVTVTTNAGCGWTASSNATWITITSGTPGSGTAPLNFSVTANTTSTPRTGTLTVAGQPLTLTQPSTNQPPSAPTGLVIR